MTVNTTNITSGPYAGNDLTTQFSYTFRIEDKGQVLVYEKDSNGVITTKIVDTDYTVSDIGVDTGGLVTFGVAPVSGSTIYIRSNYPNTQLTDFDSQGGFFPDVHEAALDGLTFQIQQVNDQIGRCVRLDDNDFQGSLDPLPTLVASAFIRTTSDGTGVEFYTASISPVTAAIPLSSYTELDALLSADYPDGQVVYVTEEGIDGAWIPRTGVHSSHAGTIRTFGDNAGRYWERSRSQAVNPRWSEADNTGTFDTGAALLAAQAVDAIELSKGTYRISSTFDMSTGKYISGKGYETTLSLSGDSKTGFSFSDNDIMATGFAVDGNKPTVGWETTSNFDFGMRMGSQTGSVKGDYIVTSMRFKDLGMDGIVITNTNTALIGDSYFQNCRRTSIAVIDGDTGTSAVHIHDILIDSDYGGGPPGKEYPLFAFDIEPDGPGSGGSANGVKKASLDGFQANMGRVSSFRPAVATLENCTVRNGIISGSRGQLSSTNDETVWSNIHLCEDAYVNIDTDAESAITRPWLSDITINRSTDDEVLNSNDGRHNLLPADWIHIDDGAQSLSGTGSITTEGVAVDGILTRVSNFTVTTGTGSASAIIPCAGDVAIDDNVVIVMLIDRTDANSNNDPVVRVNLSQGATEVLDRTYSMPVGQNQWVTVAVKSTVAATTPDFLVGLSGTPTQDVSIRVKKAFVFVNPKRLDYPSLKIGHRQAVKTFTGTLTGCTTSPTGTLRWTIEGSRVMLEFPATYGTSNSTTATITGLPESIRPDQSQTVMMAMTRDNGVDNVSGCQITTAGVVVLFKGASDNTFTASGSKGVSECTIFYSLI